MSLETLFELYDSNVHAAALKALPPDELHGLLTAIHCGPSDLDSAVWLPLAFESGQVIPERLEKLLPQIAAENLSVINAGDILCFLRYHEENGKETADVSGWAKGFLAGMSLFNADIKYSGDDLMKKILEPLRFLAGDIGHMQEAQLKTFNAMRSELVEEIEYLVMDVYWHAREEYFGEEFDEEDD